MRKLIAGFAMSLDGFIEGENGAIDWIIYDKDHFKELARSWKSIDAMFHGRKTYEAAQRMSKGKKQPNPFSHMKHYVFSNTLKEIDDDYIQVKGDLRENVMQIKNSPGKDIAVFGGAELVSSLLNENLLDELQLAICPVILGKGKPFFQNISSRKNLSLSNVKHYSSGLVVVNYVFKTL